MPLKPKVTPLPCRCLQVLSSPLFLRPINLEVTQPNLEDSNDDDNLENLPLINCNSMEVIFQLKGPVHEESSHSIEAFNKLRSMRLDILPSLTRVWETGSSQPMFTGSSFGNLKSLRLPSLELLEVDDVQNLSLLAPKLIATHPRMQVYTALRVAKWMGDLNATLRNIYVITYVCICAH
ncbi:hypothetical protein DVH24_032999 [Malus domestica]|uniref:Disease resistance protein At4g27190-like leucine-rich repeats domain-containing protein n=1 Tax=Malus domestica TaxID=3750 RepID=A0A498IRE2_MALDO|nr:hypothetical protein DVH24_032999 [Malus domestica]